MLKRFLFVIVILLAFVHPAAADALTLEDRVFGAILKLAPPDKSYERLPGWEETSDERLVRYVEIAKDIADISEELCTTTACAHQTAAFLVGIAYHESGFFKDVDIGPCFRSDKAHKDRCDGGRAFGLWQAWSSDVEGNRRAAARLAVRTIRGSINACRALPPGYRLTAYSGGRCRVDGRPAAASLELTSSYLRAEALMRAVRQTMRATLDS